MIYDANSELSELTAPAVPSEFLEPSESAEVEVSAVWPLVQCRREVLTSTDRGGCAVDCWGKNTHNSFKSEKMRTFADRVDIIKRLYMTELEEGNDLEAASGFEIEAHNDSNSTDSCDGVYPMTEIRIDKVQYSVLHLHNLVIKRNQLVIDPEFQRNEVWSSRQKCELIESILMGIPIPVIYLFESKEGRRQVVDGRQRIMAILDYYNNKFALRDLKILHGAKYQHCWFKELDPKSQALFEDYQLSFYVIQPPTPERVKYDIFDRVNRGGTRLNNQEMRNALYYGRSTKLLKYLALTPEFLTATEGSISDKRMKGRYIISRRHLVLTARTTRQSA